MQPKLSAYISTLFPLVALDRASKALAVAHLPTAVPRQVIGNVVRFTLLFNRDAAMNISLGSWSRWGFAAIAVLGTLYVTRLLRVTTPNDWVRAAALGAIAAGAIGNLIDRLLSERGVVDFIDVGIGTHRFWTFNVADSALMVGAAVLAWVFSRETSLVASRSS